MLIKKKNSFLVKPNGNSNRSVRFSSEKNNLYNKNSFKFSGNASKKTVRDVRKMAKAVVNQKTKQEQEDEEDELAEAALEAVFAQLEKDLEEESMSDDDDDIEDFTEEENSMIQNLVELTHVPRKRIVEWFDLRRREVFDYVFPYAALGASLWSSALLTRETVQKPSTTKEHKS
ncbi:hypothetical protein R1flu_003866 [Riccia fluitans]|uniref:Ribosomal eL28/Mak16 domain-containing protein n=1 Tax=Riccia fluitans TaxID=41844 RepID=A0ABD1YA64_9MARC